MVPNMTAAIGYNTTSNKAGDTTHTYTQGGYNDSTLRGDTDDKLSDLMPTK